MNQKLVKKTRLFHPDLIRAIAILQVIYIHVTYHLLGNSHYPDNLSKTIMIILHSGTRVTVPLFIMLSGYLLLDRPFGSFFKLLKKIVFRLLIPLLFWFALEIKFDIIWWNLPKNFTDVIKLFTTSDLYHLYFLQALIGLYFTIPIFQWLNQRLSVKWQILLLVGLLGYTLTAPLEIKNMYILFTYYLGYFYFGYLIKKTKITKKTSFLLLGFYLTLSIITSFAANFLLIPNLESVWTNFSFNIVLMSLAIFVFLINSDKILGHLYSKVFKKGITFLAVNSYGIYLSHVFILNFLEKNPNFLFSVNQVTIWPPFFRQFFLTVIASYLLTKLASKIPLVKNLFGFA